MEPKYSKKEFDGYTHRFVVKLKVDDEFGNDTNLNIYSNSGSYQELDSFIDEKKSDKVTSFDIIHRATKEDDEMASRFLGEFLDNI